MNKIILHGRLTKDIELKTTQSGIKNCSFNVAVDRGYGEEKMTDFFTCTAWREKAEFLSKYFSKGQEILIEGEMRSSSFEDKEGNKKTIWTVNILNTDFCGKKSDRESSEQKVDDGLEEIDDSDLPF